MEQLNNQSGESGAQDTNEMETTEEYGEFDPVENAYNAAIDAAKAMVDPEACPDSDWEQLQPQLVDLSAKMIEWHDKHDGERPEEISQEDAAAYRQLDNKRADIAIKILPDKDEIPQPKDPFDTFKDLRDFYQKLDEAARLKQKKEKSQEM